MVQISVNAPMRQFNTFGLDVRAAVFAEYDNLDALKMVLSNEIVRQHSSLIWNIGQGSNILFSGDFKGVILHGKIKGIETLHETEESALLRIGAGETFDDIIEYTVSHQLYGAENLSAIPGETGAAAVQNIGAYGAEFGDIVEYVEALNTETLEIEQISQPDCHYAYRDSIFKHQPYKQRYIITAVVIKLSKHPSFNLEYGNVKTALADKEITLRNVRDAIIDIRANKLPDYHQLGNAGSFFKNPVITEEQFLKIKAQYPNVPSYKVEAPVNNNGVNNVNNNVGNNGVNDDNNSVVTPMVKVPAGWLIEHSGLKGYKHGGAQVYEKQCLVLINTGNATSEELVELSEIVIAKVKETFGIEISPEVNII